MFQSLPDVVLRRILAFAFRSIYDVNDWKRHFPLLAVCHQLRAFAKPKLYKHGYIFRKRKPFGSPPDRTNEYIHSLELAAAANSLHYIQRLNIIIGCILGKPFVLESLLNALHKYSGTWNKVTWVSLDTTIDWELVGSKQAKNLVKKLYETLPSVQNLAIMTMIPYMAYAVDKRIAQVYWEQLTSLTFEGSWSTDSIRFEQLKYLEFAAHGRVTGFPRFSWETIEEIHVRQPGPQNTWIVFGSQAGRIELPRLRVLNMEYTHYLFPEPDASRYQLYMPGLKELTINAVLAYCPILNWSVFPQELDGVTIDALAAHVETIAPVVLPKCKALILRIWGGSPNCIGNLNRLLEGCHLCRVATLSLMGYDLNVDSLCFPGLTTLEIQTPVSALLLGAILTRHPRLDKLVVGLSDSDISEDQGVLHTRLTCLMVTHSFDKACNTRAFKHLIVRLPGLRKIFAYCMDAEELRAFIRDNSQQFPHLLNIKV
ncbi:hypothetical protein BX667DRAFT_494968 [Coemansia mojavensis]|nr:hypothetical protein BX667DRAFT_494968 [Coemansia mojavensis]